jgi:hypothetical protein
VQSAEKGRHQDLAFRAQKPGWKEVNYVGLDREFIDSTAKVVVFKRTFWVWLRLRQKVRPHWSEKPVTPVPTV